ncbi:hypothetical protein Tco_0401988 [Tanacetum coccineum]
MIRLRAEAPSTSHSPLPHIILSHTRADTPPSGTPPLLPISLPTSSPSLLLPSADHEPDRPEVCLPPRKRLCFAFGPRYEVGKSPSAAAKLTGGFSYGITDTWDEMLVDMPGAPGTDDTKGYVTAYYCIGSAGSDYRVAGSEPQETGGDYRVAGSGPQETGIVH